ncbi:hypothetical protein [Bremerella cremea]|uniref:hypothetical protein n=1 Tax=Bremerella cremea TaxID=1031537 RepID=UPI0031EFA80E
MKIFPVLISAGFLLAASPFCLAQEPESPVKASEVGSQPIDYQKLITRVEQIYKQSRELSPRPVRNYQYSPEQKKQAAILKEDAQKFRQECRDADASLYPQRHQSAQKIYELSQASYRDGKLGIDSLLAAENDLASTEAYVGKIRFESYANRLKRLQSLADSLPSDPAKELDRLKVENLQLSIRLRLVREMEQTTTSVIQFSESIQHSGR